ncbi:MAG: hypothetical protein HRU41_04975 [Saprospiraceae bacterium]|nr:hypothetical protein [Saprospiraceae bacterium]
MADDKKKTFNTEDLKATLRQQERERLKAELEEIEAKSTTKPAKIRRLYWIGGISAAAAIALLLIYIGLLPRFAPSPGDLFSQYFEPMPNILASVERGQESSPPDNSVQDTAIAFGTGSPSSPGDEELSLIKDFYQANELLSEDKAAEAIPLLTPLAGQESDFGQAASWYLALAYLKTLELDQAKELFRAIVKDTGHPYQEESEAILKVLMGG